MQKPNQQKTKKLKLCLLFLLLIQRVTVKCVETDPSPRIREGKGTICFLGRVQESELELLLQPQCWAHKA